MYDSQERIKREGRNEEREREREEGRKRGKKDFKYLIIGDLYKKLCFIY